jgi:hypothetical protein
MRWGFSPSLHRLKAQWEKPPCGAQPRIELGPAVQQADVLPEKKHLFVRMLKITRKKILQSYIKSSWKSKNFI